MAKLHTALLPHTVSPPPISFTANVNSIAAAAMADIIRIIPFFISLWYPPSNHFRYIVAWLYVILLVVKS